MQTPIRWAAAALLGSALLLAGSAMAQQAAPDAGTAPGATAQAPTGLWLTTPFPELSIASGATGDIPLTLTNKGLPPQRAELSIEGLPKGWTAKFEGDGHDVTAAMVRLDSSESVTLQLTPPKDATSGTEQFQVVANYGSATAALPLEVTLTAKKAGGIALAPDLPALKGSAKSTYDYRIKITNNSPSDALFNLTAQAPDGFTTTFKQGYGSEEITGLPIKAGENQTATLEVKPYSSVKAGSYPILVKVIAGDLSASTRLSLDVTGAPELQLSGPQDRLSGEAVAGQATTFPFTLHNSGSAPANDVKLSASAPSGWTVSFDPSAVPTLDAGADQQVQVKIQPSEKAIAGDYMVNIDADGSGLTQSAAFRVTVNTSTWWGIVGVAVIAVAVIILVLAVLKYGRR
jgi:uncharacterized membrane protein